jgi:RloB-like protein
MGRRNRERKPSRKHPVRDARPLILVVSEGLNTEPSYFNGLAQQFSNRRVRVETRGGEGTPKAVVKAAKDYREEAIQTAKAAKDNNLIYEEVWCVFDRDEFTDIRDAFQMARDNGIRVAFSNPNFELWLYLHFRDQPGMKHRHDMIALVCEVVPVYDPEAKLVDISLFLDGYGEAVKRAERLCRRQDDLPLWDRNPYTDVHILTELIAAPAPEAPEPDSEPAE